MIWRFKKKIFLKMEKQNKQVQQEETIKRNEYWMNIAHLLMKSEINTTEEGLSTVHVFGGAIRDYIAEEPINDIDMYVFSTKKFDTIAKIMSLLYFRFGDENVKTENRTIVPGKPYHAVTLTVHDEKYGSMKFDLVEISIETFKCAIRCNSGQGFQDLDFDVNGFVEITENKRYSNGGKTDDVYKNCFKKQFNVMINNIPKLYARRIENLKENTSGLVRMLKLAFRYKKMISRGWKCLNFGKTPETFQKFVKQMDCYNKDNKEDNKSEICCICRDVPENFFYKLPCCGEKSLICHNCNLENIRQNFGKSFICCPMCRGNPFFI